MRSRLLFPRSFGRGRGSVSRIEGACLTVDTGCMAKKPELPKPTTWTIYKLAAKQEPLGVVEVLDEATAIEKAAAEFKAPSIRFFASQGFHSGKNPAPLRPSSVTASG
jgi:hypothetical protein